VPKVYCVTEPLSYKNGEPQPLFDISGALKFGEIEVLTKHGHSLVVSEPVVSMLREKLVDYCDDDYILPIGDPLMIGVVVAIAADINSGFVRMLKWDKRTRDYLVMPVDIYGNPA